MHSQGGYPTTWQFHPDQHAHDPETAIDLGHYDKIRSTGPDEITLPSGQSVSLHEARTVVARWSTSGSRCKTGLELHGRDGVALAAIVDEADVNTLVSALAARGAMQPIMTLRAAIAWLGAEWSRASEPRDAFEAVSDATNARFDADWTFVAHRATEREVQMPRKLVDQLRRAGLIAFRNAQGHGYFELTDEGIQMFTRFAQEQH